MAPWWLSLWVLVLGGMVVLGGAVLWLQWRIRRQFMRNLLLETRLEANAEALDEANRALEAAALVDTVTGLHNRRFLYASMATDAPQAQRAFADMLAAGRDPLAAKEDILLFLMDLDHFTQINETWGHAGGDAVLRQLAQALKGITRKTDFRVRWEQGKFLLVARRSRRAGAIKVARHILSAVRDLAFQLPGGETIRKHISIGFTALPMHPGHPDLGTWQQALGIAEQCLEAAKLSGRDRWVGAFLKPDADPGPLAGLDVWDTAWAEAQGLMSVECSEPYFVWPAH